MNCSYQTANTFDDILNIDLVLETKDFIPENEKAPKPDANHPLPPYVKQKSGRSAIHVKYPEIIEATLEFLKVHGFAAQSRRRHDIFL